jgi:hypothetical protein
VTANVIWRDISTVNNKIANVASLEGNVLQHK